MAFQSLFNNEEFLKLFCHDDSYFWKNRQEVTDLIKVLNKKDLYMKSKVLARFEEYLKDKIKELNPAAAIKTIKDDVESSDEEKAKIPVVKKFERIIKPGHEGPRSCNSEKLLTGITNRVKGMKNVSNSS